MPGGPEGPSILRSMAAETFCEACGRKASDEARFCAGCGRKLGPGAVAAGARDPVPRAPQPGGPAAEETVLELRRLAVRSLGEFLLCLLTVGLAWIVLRIARASVRYRITTQRLVVRTGLVSVTSRTVELFRVKDLEVQQPWFQRMRGAGSLLVRSQDAGEPLIVLESIPGVEDVHERLRDLVARERRRMQVKVFEED